jgi:hypothetical protein
MKIFSKYLSLIGLFCFSNLLALTPDEARQKGNEKKEEAFENIGMGIVMGIVAGSSMMNGQIPAAATTAYFSANSFKKGFKAGKESIEYYKMEREGRETEVNSSFESPDRIGIDTDRGY